jgi:hypothetical protein
LSAKGYYQFMPNLLKLVFPGTATHAAWWWNYHKRFVPNWMRNRCPIGGQQVQALWVMGVKKSWTAVVRGEVKVKVIGARAGVVDKADAIDA